MADRIKSSQEIVQVENVPYNRIKSSQEIVQVENVPYNRIKMSQIIVQVEYSDISDYQPRHGFVFLGNLGVV